MYDSDEVRDKVRQEMVAHLFSPMMDEVVLSAAERAALEEARAAYRRALEDVADAYLVAHVERVVKAFKIFVEKVIEALKPALEDIAESVNKLGAIMAELNELLWPADEGDGFSWRRRPRRPEVRAVRGVDAVAAGRSPGMIVRTRIRGGRR